MGKFDHLTLEQVESYYRNGIMTLDETTEYIKLWNAGPHFTQAILHDGRIKNWEPEKIKLWWPHLIEKFGVRL